MGSWSSSQMHLVCLVMAPTSRGQGPGLLLWDFLPPSGTQEVGVNADCVHTGSQVRIPRAKLHCGGNFSIQLI